MPQLGSVNQTVSSDLTITPFGELSCLPLNLSASVVIVPSYSVRVTRRVPCSQETKRPWRSRVLPLVKLDGWRNKSVRPAAAWDALSRAFVRSLKIRACGSPNHTGPSVQTPPVQTRTRPAVPPLYLAKRGSKTSKAGSG